MRPRRRSVSSKWRRKTSRGVALNSRPNCETPPWMRPIRYGSPTVVADAGTTPSIPTKTSGKTRSVSRRSLTRSAAESATTSPVRATPPIRSHSCSGPSSWENPNLPQPKPPNGAMARNPSASAKANGNNTSEARLLKVPTANRQ